MREWILSTESAANPFDDSGLIFAGAGYLAAIK
jgi:hypothetical protein